jgi:Zn-dependent protease with chaperone function
MQYLALLVVAAGVTFWQQIVLLLSSAPRSRASRDLKDPSLLSRIGDVSGLQLTAISIIDSHLPYGLLVGLANHPTMVFSTALYDSFTREEREYVALHEAAHAKFGHNAKEAVVFMISYLLGCALLLLFSGTLSWIIAVPLLGIVIGATNIQFARLFELQAERFAVEHVSNPHAVITATEKFRAAYAASAPRERSLRRRLFYRAVPYDTRIALAKERAH